jgi:hypothetical protein
LEWAKTETAESRGSLTVKEPKQAQGVVGGATNE